MNHAGRLGNEVPAVPQHSLVFEAAVDDCARDDEHLMYMLYS